MNYAGALTVRVTAAGAGSLLDEVERLLAKAAASKSRYLRLADRAARLYAPMVHATAALTAIGWLVAGASWHDAIVTAIAVLIITCPCALALAIPAVQVVASGAMFRAGLILNNGDAIERLAEADTVIFDKTGTLTLPEPRVANGDAVDAGLLERAARLALSSRHPLARAVAQEACDKSPYDAAIEVPGQGVRAMIDGSEARLGSPAFCGIAGVATTDDPATSVIAFSHAGRSAVLLIRQQLRPDAIAVVKALRQRGLDITILSGDREAAVAPIAAALGIENWSAVLTPVQKIGVIDELKARQRRVLMVGDGLNDAPALGGHACVVVADRRRAHHAGAGGCGLSRRAAQTGTRRGPDRGARAASDEPEPVARGDLQRHRGADRDCRLRHAADRRAGDVRLIDPGDGQCLAGAPSGRCAPAGGRRGAGIPRGGEDGGVMNVLVYLLPAALSLGLIGVVAFLWSLRSGQYDDVEGAALRILDDDDVTSGA